MNNFATKVDSLKVAIDLLGLDIENLAHHEEKKEAIEALEHSVLSLIENKSKTSAIKEKAEGKFVCATCGKHFASDYKLNCHKSRGKKACEMNLKRKYENEEGKVACTQCDYKSNSKPNYRFHFVRHHTKRYHCEKCNLNFGKRLDLIYHLKKNHPGVEVPLKKEQKEGIISCADCDFKTNQEKSLTLHQIKHTDKFKCENCHHRFHRNYDLVKHNEKIENCEKYLKNADYPYSCPECGKGFTLKKNIVRHKALH